MTMVPLIQIWVEFGRGILNRDSIKVSPFNDCPDPDVRTNVPTVRCSRILNDQNFEHTGGTHECCSLEWMMLLLSQHALKKNYLSDLLILEPSSQDSPIFRANSTKIMKFMNIFTKNHRNSKFSDHQITLISQPKKGARKKSKFIARNSQLKIPSTKKVHCNCQIRRSKLFWVWFDLEMTSMS